MSQRDSSCLELGLPRDSARKPLVNKITRTVEGNGRRGEKGENFAHRTQMSLGGLVTCNLDVVPPGDVVRVRRVDVPAHHFFGFFMVSF